MATDLFGRPIFDAPRAKQPPLFGALGWFRSGYRDAAYGTYAERTGQEQPAYRLGYEAGLRALQATREGTGEHSGEDMDRAWRQNVAVEKSKDCHVGIGAANR